MEVSEIKRIAVLGGGGIIGSSWSTYFLWKGFPVAVYDVNDQALTLSRDRIAANLNYLAEKGILTEKAASMALGRYLQKKSGRPFGMPSSFRKRSLKAMELSNPLSLLWTSTDPRTPCSPAAHRVF
jgi:hypothetical protein